MALVTGNHIFIHVPKTGGTWVREQIRITDPGSYETGDFEVEDHYGVKDVLEEHPTFVDKKFFGFVRHPLTWYPSRWAWALLTNFNEKIKKEGHPARNHWMAQVWSMNFQEFIDRVIEMRTPHATRTFEDKLMYRGRWVRVGLYERLVIDFESITSLPTHTIQIQKPGAMVLRPNYSSPAQAYELCLIERDVIREFYT